MSTTLDDTPSRSWWSLNKKDGCTPDKQTRKHQAQAKSSGLNFGSIATVIGLKSKKQQQQPPSLTIQQPPAPVLSPEASPSVTTRPSSKATSSTRSRIDSLEPRTPVDIQRDRRQSLLTLSDTDPFAGRPIIAVPSPHLPSDPNRLSALSNSSVSELPHKKLDGPTFNRVSYASSSSHSHSHAADPPSSFFKDSRKLRSKRSTGSLQVNTSDPSSRHSSLSPSIVSTSKLPPSASYAEKGRSPTQDGMLSRPRMRPRGMTDGGVPQKAGFFVEERPDVANKHSPRPSSPTFSQRPDVSRDFNQSPRLIVRQPSASRLCSPPTAPPTHSLPATPFSLDDDALDHSQPLFTRTESASSSCISFASSVSLTNDLYVQPYGIRERERTSSQHNLYVPQVPDRERDGFKGSKTAPSSPRILKKSISHQSFGRRPSSAPKTPPEHAIPPPPPPTQSPPSEKSFRKQRSFHHPRLPIPSIPLPMRSSHSNSTAFPSTSDAPPPSGPEKKRRGSSSSGGRRRLFSGSSSKDRASTSQGIPSSDGDDARSMFSYRSDIEAHVHSFKPWLVPSKPQSSFWEEGNSEASPSSPVRSHPEYTPQHILSPAERAKLEAEVGSPTPSRGRAFSLMSTSTMMSDLDRDADSIITPLSPPPARRPASKQLSSRNHELSTGAPGISSGSNTPTGVSHSSRDNHDFRRTKPVSSAASQVTIRPATSPTHIMTSLPPPPRQRPRGSVSVYERPNTAPAIPMPTPPPGFYRSLSTTSTSTLTKKNKSTVEKAMHRKSIMKKSSFLDIDDETDKESEPEQVSGSFLDLARESFDTSRTDA